MNEAKKLIVDLCRQFYGLGWVSGTGGGVSIREGKHIYIAPSGVQKERLDERDLFTLNLKGELLELPQDTMLKPSACTPLFMNAYRLREAGAVLHSHSMHAMLATLMFKDEFQMTQIEMMKGLRGIGYYDTLRIPIIENTAHECELADAMADAMNQYPDVDAVLVRRHGLYVWGRTWIEAKTQAECLDYLFEASIRMHQLGFSVTKSE